MRRYFKILKFFLKSKYVFKNPKNCELVIFDGESPIIFDNFIFNYEFFLLECRLTKITKIYFTFKILKLFFKYYKGNIMTAYLVALLKVIGHLI